MSGQLHTALGSDREKDEKFDGDLKHPQAPDFLASFPKVPACNLLSNATAK
jgi:hypothetical protein